MTPAPASDRPVAGRAPISTGEVELVADRGDPQGWTVLVNGVPSSYVHLGDPTRLEFEYVQWLAAVLDAAAEPGTPLRTTHLGGAGCTLPRYLAATRPRSLQQVFEIDPDLADLAREVFGMRRTATLRVRAVDARAGLLKTSHGTQQVVVRDAFAGDQVPSHLSTMEFLAVARRAMTADGLYLANLADGPPLRRARAEVSTALACFPHVALLAEPSLLRGRRRGNLVLMASRAPLPVAEVARTLASGSAPARVVHGSDLRDFASEPPLTDGAPGTEPSTADRSSDWPYFGMEPGSRPPTA